MFFRRPACPIQFGKAYTHTHHGVARTCSPTTEISAVFEKKSLSVHLFKHRVRVARVGIHPLNHCRMEAKKPGIVSMYGSLDDVLPISLSEM